MIAISHVFLLPIFPISFLHIGIETAALKKYTDRRTPPSTFSKSRVSLKKKTKSKAGIELAKVLKKQRLKNNLFFFDPKEKKLNFVSLGLL